MNNFHDFELQDLSGEKLKLSSFQGNVVLIVNVASKCGLTPQYEKLEPLYQQYKDKGLIILGVPCNQFMGQEPGSSEEIQSFCSTKYNVTFPMSSKVDVNGDTRDPLYQFLAGDKAAFPGDIQWNFEKFLIGKDGTVINRFSPKTEPDDSTLMSDLIKALEPAL